MTASSVASAPGKCILFGEHSVVYGYPAVAAALSDLRIYVEAALHADGPFMEVVLCDLPSAQTGTGGAPVSLCMPFETIRDGMSSSSCGVRTSWWDPSPPPDLQISALNNLITFLPELDRSALYLVCSCAWAYYPSSSNSRIHNKE